MSGVSKNSFDLIRSAALKLKGNMLKAFLATLIVVSPLMLCCFTVYGIVAAVMLWAVFQVGYIRYMRALLNGENPSYAVLFSEFTAPWLEIFLGAILISMYLVGMVVFVIPGIILVGLFSMTVFFSEYKNAKTPFEAMGYSSKYMRGNIMNMFAFKVLFWAAYLMVMVIGLLGVLGVIKLWANFKIWSILLLIIIYVLTTLAWSFITVYYHATTELFFNELLVYADRKNKTVVEEKQVEVTEEQPQEKVVEEKPKKVVARKPATKTTDSTAKTTKSTAKPTTVKKTTTAKSTSTTATKTTTKKTTSK